MPEPMTPTMMPFPALDCPPRAAHAIGALASVVAAFSRGFNGRISITPFTPGRDFNSPARSGVVATKMAFDRVSTAPTTANFRDASSCFRLAWRAWIWPR